MMLDWTLDWTTLMGTLGRGRGGGVGEVWGGVEVYAAFIMSNVVGRSVVLILSEFTTSYPNLAQNELQNLEMDLRGLGLGAGFLDTLLRRRQK